MKLSVIVPVYNEFFTVEEILRRVAAVEIPKEIIVVDDGSTDGTVEILKRLEDEAGDGEPLKVVFHGRNRGKGAAIRTGLREVTGDVIIIQDADLEYDPQDYHKLLQPIRDGRAHVVYGSRFRGEVRRVLYFWHSFGNRVVTTLSNMLTNLNLTDMETCYKMFRREVLEDLELKADGFGFEPEVTFKVARGGWRIYEVPISYSGREYWEGKKITWWDGVATIGILLKYALWDDRDIGHWTLEELRRAPRYNGWVAERLLPFVGRRVLEVGAGVGTMTRYFATCEHVYATDRDSHHLRILQQKFGERKNFTVGAFDLEKGDSRALEGQGIDTILAINVLEHLADDAAALGTLHRILVPGGRLILFVPAMPNLYGSLDRNLGHVRRYARGDLRTRLEAAGFAVQELAYFNRLGVFGWFVNGRLLRRRRIPPVQVRIFNLLVPLFRLAEGVPLPFGQSLVAVGVKPSQGIRTGL